VCRKHSSSQIYHPGDAALTSDAKFQSDNTCNQLYIATPMAVYDRVRIATFGFLLNSSKLGGSISRDMLYTSI
jgi:hypothetical protein